MTTSWITDRTIKPPIYISKPLCLVGFTRDGRMVLGGAFQLADTMGVPLWFALDEADKMRRVISMPHYFSSAMEAGWSAEQAFGKIREALGDRGCAADFEGIRRGCIVLFTDVARTVPEEPPKAIGRRLRELLESDSLAHAAWQSLHK